MIAQTMNSGLFVVVFAFSIGGIRIIKLSSFIGSWLLLSKGQQFPGIKQVDEQRKITIA